MTRIVHRACALDTLRITQQMVMSLFLTTTNKKMEETCNPMKTAPYNYFSKFFLSHFPVLAPAT